MVGWCGYCHARDVIHGQTNKNMRSEKGQCATGQLIRAIENHQKVSFKIEPLSSPGINLTCYLELFAFLGYQTFCVFHIKFVMNNLGNKFAQTELI